MNKVEKIKAEIDRLQSSTLDENINFKSQYDQGIFDGLSLIDNFIDSLEEEPVSEDLEYASEKYACRFSSSKYGHDKVKDAFITGAQWQKENLWKPADGDDLPEIDREVIALIDNGKVVFAHRPPEYWDGKNILTGEVTRYKPKRYDNGGWNQPDVKWWLDIELPKEK